MVCTLLGPCLGGSLPKAFLADSVALNVLIAGIIAETRSPENSITGKAVQQPALVQATKTL